MREELYADGVGEITVTGTIVRIDFVSLSHDQRDAHNNPKPVVRQRVIMPGDAFAEAVKLMQKAVAGLSENKPADRRTVLPIRDAAAPAAEPTGRNGSPNFN